MCHYGRWCQCATMEESVSAPLWKRVSTYPYGRGVSVSYGRCCQCAPMEDGVSVPLWKIVSAYPYGRGCQCPPMLPVFSAMWPPNYMQQSWRVNALLVLFCPYWHDLQCVGGRELTVL